MNKRPKISIITVCFNSISTIRKTIESVLAQSYLDFEHIFVDGGSTDGTIELIKSYEDAYSGKLVFHSGKDKGIYDAMNKGIELSRGDVIGIINSDDWYDSTALTEIMNTYCKRSNDLIVITGDLVRTTINEKFLYLQKHGINSITLEKLTSGMPLQHPAVFASKQVYEAIGSFDISYRYLADYDFVWRCFETDKVQFAFTGTTTSYMREGGASDTFKVVNIMDRTIERFRLRREYIGILKALITSTNFLATEVAKQSLKRILPQKFKNVYYTRKHGKENSKVNSHDQFKKMGFIQKANDFLRDYPAVRNSIVVLIRYVQYYLATVNRYINNDPDGFITGGRRMTPKYENCFFGYYDKSPYSEDGQYVLYHSIPNVRAPRKNEVAKYTYSLLMEKSQMYWNLKSMESTARSNATIL